jgi:16S rRNA (guanine(527)-N(7))-methyltransferase RsmG
MSDRRPEFALALQRAIKELGLRQLTREQMGKMAEHYAMLVKWNRRVNLTNIIEPGQAARLHYAEALFGSQFLGDARAALDIGSGAGFPAIPMAIMRPNLRVTALEPNRKKAIFLEEVKFELKLENLSIARAHIQAFDRSGYDLLISRALPKASKVLADILTSLGERQRLMLFCTDELMFALERCAADIKVEARRIPGSRSRLIALFSKAAH